MHQIFRPFLAHQFQHLEKLLEVQILLIGDHVQAFIKIVRLLTVQRRGDVARGVQARAVRTQNDTRRHAVRFQIDDLCALALL